MEIRKVRSKNWTNLRIYKKTSKLSYSSELEQTWKIRAAQKSE